MSEYVLVCVAWPYANGPLHLGHVAGCYLPPDIQSRFERALGNKVLMVSGSDEHGTPITVAAESQGVLPQEIVDKYHKINTDALLKLGISFEPHIDPRGPEYGGALFNRTSDEKHKRIVQKNFLKLMDAGFFERKTTQQFFEERDDGGGRFLPDRYVEGICPHCDFDKARGDQCDECGATYESTDLKSPKSKMNPESKIVVKDTEHFFYRLDLFQKILEEYAEKQHPIWKNNVRSMTKNWLKMGLRSRAVTRDLDWGIKLPLDDNEWNTKCIYVWFEAVQGYYSCSVIWSELYAKESGHQLGENAWQNWWKIPESGIEPRHLYFLGKDNIPFHTVIWPALIMGLNHANSGKNAVSDQIMLPQIGDLQIAHNVPAMEYLMLAGGQFSKSRKHAVWLPSFLERYNPDYLRYYLSINMPENHDTDFNWPDFVERINNELIATYGNFIHRVNTLANRLSKDTNINPLTEWDDVQRNSTICEKVEKIHEEVTNSLRRSRFKEALRGLMSIAQLGNQTLQSSTPWAYLNEGPDVEDYVSKRKDALSKLSICWRIVRYLSITTHPFMPFQAQKVWEMMGEEGQVSDTEWNAGLKWDEKLTWSGIKPSPLFKILDLDEIIEVEKGVASIEDQDEGDNIHTIKGGKKKGEKKMKKEIEGVAWLNFDDFTRVEMRVCMIKEVDDHPDADKLYVVKVDDGTGKDRTICAGLKPYYSKEDMCGMRAVVVCNLQPRKLRGIMSEGMLLAADDEKGNVKLLTINGEIEPGSRVR